MTIRFNRVKVNANGVGVNTDFILGSSVKSFSSFKNGVVTYTALAEDGTWQVAIGTVSGTTLTRGTVQENHLGSKDQVDFTGKALQIAQTMSADYMDDITVKLDTIDEHASADMTGEEIKIAYEAEDDTNAFTDDEKAKLGTVQNNAAPDQTGAEIKILYEAELDTNAFDDVYKSKVDNIEANATTDQTGAEIKILYEAEDDTNAFDDTYRNKLNGIEENAKDDQHALQVEFTPTVTVTPLDVQSAIENVDYQARNHTHPALSLTYDPDGDSEAIPPFAEDEITDKIDIQQAMLDHSDHIKQRLFPATGLISGGKLYGIVDTSQFSIALGEGLFSTNYQDGKWLELPSILSWANQVDISIFPEVNVLTVASLHILLQKSGTDIVVIKIPGEITYSYLKDYIYLGRVNTIGGFVTGFTNAPIVARQAEANVNDLMVRSGKITGGTLNPADGSLGFWQSAGSMYYPGINWQDTGHTDPNAITFAAVGDALSPVTFRTINQNGSVVRTNQVSLVAEYDNAGVTTIIPATQATIHRMYATSVTSAQRKFIILLGQNLYANATEAHDSIASDIIVLPEETNNMDFIGYIGVTAESTDFTDSLSAWIVSSISSAIGAAVGVTTVDWADITGLTSDSAALQIELSAKAPVVHSHDDLYYTEAEIDASLALKKDDFTENTGFNKDFGVVADTVCQGDDSRLTNIKDELILSDVTGSEPPYVAGQMFYADDKFNFNTAYSDVTLQVGEEQYIEVYNNTGTTLDNGVAVYMTGLSSGMPAVALALANAFITAEVLGITTMDIPDGSAGLITTFGNVNNVNTTGLTSGARLYLSDTVPGGFTTVAPDIASSLGRSLIENATTGRLFVSIENTVALPTIYGAMHNGSAAANFNANTYYPIENYGEGDDVAMPLNLVGGGIYVPTTGKYKLTTNIVLNFDTIGNAKEDIFLAIFDESDTLIKEIQDFLGKDSEAGSFYPSFMFNAVAGKTYHLGVKCSIALNNITYSLVSFDITSVHIR